MANLVIMILCEQEHDPWIDHLLESAGWRVSIRLLTDKCNRVHSPPLVENPPFSGSETVNDPIDN